MAGGYTVNRGALTEAANGINNTISDLGQLGINEEAETGRGFSGLSLTGMQAGDPGLTSVFSGFCDRWSWGVRTLVQDGNQIAQRLGLSAGAYYDAEQLNIGALKYLVSAAIGDPEKTEAQAAGGSWSNAASQGPSTTFSGGAWKQADQNVTRTAVATGREVEQHYEHQSPGLPLEPGGI